MKLCTSDNVNVNVTFDNNLDDTPDGWVQVTGSVVGPNAITASDMWQFRAKEEDLPANSAFGNDLFCEFQVLIY